MLQTIFVSCDDNRFKSRMITAASLRWGKIAALLGMTIYLSGGHFGCHCSMVLQTGQCEPMDKCKMNLITHKHTP